MVQANEVIKAKGLAANEFYYLYMAIEFAFDAFLGLSWCLLQLLVGLASPYKYAGGEMDVKLVKSEADKLQDLVKDKALNHEEVIRIITTRSNAQIVATLNHYKDSHGTAITKVKRIAL